MVSGIYFILRTGQPWRDLPKEFGPWSSVYTRFPRWSRSVLWSQMLALLTADSCGAILSVDCTHIKVHQDASNAVVVAKAQAISKTKGGANTKLAVIVDRLGRAVGLNLVPGYRHDLKAVELLMDKFAGRFVLADRDFDAKAFREKLLGLGATPCIPPRQTNRIQYYYSTLAYAHRHVVENWFFARIKRRRRISTRYEKHSETFLAFVTLATVLDWLHFEF